MLKNLSLGAVALLIIAYLIIDNSSVEDKGISLDIIEKVKSKKDPTRPNLQQRIEGRYQHEWDMTHDPKTGTVPRERLIEAKEYTSRLLSQKAAIANVAWEERGPNNVSGRTRSILIDAADPSHNTLFSGGVAGGIWRSTDGANTWTQIDDFFDNMAIGDITQDPNDNSIIYFGTGEGYGNIDAVRGLGIWRSTDGGLSFDQLASTDDDPDFHYVNSMLCLDLGANTAVLSGNRFSGIFRSLDDGATWTNVLGGSITDMTLASNGDVYAGVDNDGIYRSTDGGITWVEVYNNSSVDARIELGSSPSDPDVVYALIEGAGATIPSIRRTTDGGDTWPSLNTPLWNDQSCTTTSQDWTRGQDWYDLTVAVDPNDPDRVFIGGVDLFATSDGGNNWTQVSSWIPICGRPLSHADQHALLFAPGSSDVLYNGNDGGIYKSTNASATTPDFDFMGNGYNITQFYACDIHPDAGEDFFLAGSQDNGTQRFQGPGLVNTSQATGGDGGFCHIDQLDPSIMITSFTRNNYSVSLDGGATFQIGPRINSGRFINPTDYDDEIKVLYGADNFGQCFRWTNPSTGGLTSSSVDVTNLIGQISTVRVSPNVSDRVYFGSNGDIYRVDNASTSTPMVAERIFDGPNNFISSIDIEIGDEDHIVFTVSNFGEQKVFVSTDANTDSPNFENIDGNLPDIPVRWAAFSPNDSDQLLIATELGVWSTDNIQGAANTDWGPTNTDLANVRVDMIKFRESDQTMIAGTHGRGLYSTRAFDNQLFFSKTVSASTANELDILTYELEIFNNNLGPITNVVVTDVLDPGLEYVAGSLTCGSISGSTITINEASIAAGQTITCTFQAQLVRGNFSTIAFEDDIEGGEANWTIENNRGAATWSTNSDNPNSPSTSWFSPNTGVEDNTQFLVLDPMTITANNQLSFFHDFDTEDGWDGGFVEISVNGGATWVDLEPYFLENGYTGVLGTNQNTDINGRAAFTGNSGGYIQSRIDLSSFNGQTAQIRFVFGEDNNTNVTGWYIDDVQIIEAIVVPNEACITTAEGDNICSQTATSVFECEIDCFACDDGIQNGDETGLDCGGRDCVPCDCTDDTVVYDATTIPNGTLLRVNRFINIQDMVDIPLGTVFLYAGDEITVDSDFTIERGTTVTMDADDCDDTSLPLPPTESIQAQEK